MHLRTGKLKLTRKLVVGAVVFGALIISGCVYFFVIKAPVSTNNEGDKKVLSVSDLEDSSIKLNGETSDASVENISKELKAKINTDVSAKQNPFEAVAQLADVLASTTNTARQDQLTSFVADFLANHSDELWLPLDSETPDQAQVNYWMATLYAKVVYNYQFMTQNKFTGADGKLLDTTKEMLKYIDLYLALAKDPASQSSATDEYKNAPLAYTYNDSDNFIKLRNEIVGR